MNNRYQNIDSHVVEMRFDNKQFEAGAKQTMSTLSKLKEALKLPQTAKALEGIDKATKNISLDGIAAGVDVLNKRFSTLGIVGMRVIENITDGLMNKLNAAVNFVSNSIISGGIKRAMNIENAHFQLQALLKDETKVQAVMADAMESVDGTAYAYDEAAKAASQFAASGIQAGDEMLGALKGITGVAAMTNSSFEDISRVFTTVAGNGRLMGDQLLQLSSRGLNAASTLADYYKEVRGQSSMTEGTIREMVSKGKISFKEFSDAMTWAFGDSAKRANETFTGSLSNMKSALARIGAGFISPLVEQNGELVQLFNALRIKINDVKTALVFDEQSSAISGLANNTSLLNDTISKYIKNGEYSFDKVTKSILGTAKSEEELAEINEKVSETFEKVKKAGYISSDMLKEFEDNGLSVAKSTQKYINGVLDGSVKVSYDVKKSIEELTGGYKVSTYAIQTYAKEGKLSFDMFSDAMASATSKVSEQTEILSDTYKAMFATIKKNGKVSKEDLEELGKNGIKSATVIRDYINGVADGSIRASYSIKTTVEELTKTGKLVGGDVTRLAEEGLITFDIFQSAMEETYGDSMALSKQFNDSFLGIIKNIVTAINEADMTKPMEIFYYWVESAKNVLKGLWSVLKPVGLAFSDVFLTFNADDIISFSEAIEKLTSKMKLSEKSSNNLHDAFKGVFSVGKLLLDITFSLIGAFSNVGKPIAVTGDGFLDLIGAMGRSLTWITKTIRSCELLNRGFRLVKKGIKYGFEGLSWLVSMIKKFVGIVSKLPGSQKLLESILNAFTRFGKFASPYVNDFLNEVERLAIDLFNLGDIDLETILGKISTIFSDIADSINSLNLSKPGKIIDEFKDKVKDLLEVLEGNEGLMTFVTNLKEYGNELKEAFTFDNLLDRVEKVMSIFGKFFNWIKTTFGPAFEDFNVGSAIAAGGGIGIIYSLIKISKSFENLSKSLKSVPDLFNGIRGTLVAYQKDLKADAILKIAGAITLLAVALVLLSFADTDRLMSASFALAIVASVLMSGISSLLTAINKGRELNNAATIFSKGLSSAMQKLGRAVEIKALGSAIKDFAKSVAIIALSIIALGIMYKKDKEALFAGIEVVKTIGTALAVLMGLMIIGSKFGDPKGIIGIGASILMISIALSLIISSVSKLMKMELPKDYGAKLLILSGIINELAALAIVLGVAARIAGGNSLTKMAGTIIALAGLLLVTVISLKMLFDMNLPNDYMIKLGILAGIFTAFGALLLTMAIAAKISGGNSFKAAGTILAMAVFLAVIVAALFVLTLIPEDKMLKGATALGGILLALGAALYGASKVDGKAYKTVIGMAITVGVITAALAILSIVPWKKLMASTVALGVVLLALSANFKELSKIDSAKSIPAVIAMLVSIGVIAYSLYKLAEQPWDSLLAAGISIGVVLLAFAQTLKMISSMSGLKIKKIGLFLLATVALLPITGALLILAKEPWDGLLAAGIALSAVLFSFGKTMKTISALKGIKLEKILLFGLASVALLPIAYSLQTIAKEPWDGLLAAGIALSAVLLSLSVAMGIISKTKPNPTGIAAFLVGTVGVLLIAASLSIIAKEPWEGLLAAAASISIVLLALSAAMAICSLVGAAAPAAIAGMVLLDLFIVNFLAILGLLGLISKSEFLASLLSGGAEILVLIGEAIGDFVGSIVNGVLTKISSGLPQIGSDLSEFMTNLEPFIEGSKNIDGDALVRVGLLSGVIVALTAAEVINGFTRLFKLSLVDLAKELSNFMIALTPFILGSKILDEASAQACLYIAEMVLALTGVQLLNGVGRFFGLSGKLSDFAEELEAFGPKLAQFAKDVRHVKPEAVEGAASAAQMMAEVASKLQGHGGFIQQFAGDKSLATFAGELKAFGPAIARFADKVKDVTPEAVEGAASAAGIMAEMAEMLQAQGGVKQVFTGSKNLAKFGKELSSFGESMAAYYDSVSPIDTSKLDAVITQVYKIVTMANLIKDIDTSYLILFESHLENMANTGIDSFISAFENSDTKTVGAIGRMIKRSIKGIQNEQSLFSDEGIKSVKEWIKGIKDQYKEAEKIGKALVNNTLLGCRSINLKFYEAGLNTAQAFIKGFKSKIKEIEDLKETYELSNIETSSSNNPIIRPVVDLSDVNSKVNEIDSLFSRTYDLSSVYDNAISTSSSFARSQRSISNDSEKTLTSKEYANGLDKLEKAIDGLNNRPVNLNVSLNGGVEKIFDVVVEENDRQIKSTRYNPMTHTPVQKGR